MHRIMLVKLLQQLTVQRIAERVDNPEYFRPTPTWVPRSDRTTRARSTRSCLEALPRVVRRIMTSDQGICPDPLDSRMPTPA
jgi:hypothetical protein